jgi:hypothetical protein
VSLDKAEDDGIKQSGELDKIAIIKRMLDCSSSSGFSKIDSCSAPLDRPFDRGQVDKDAASDTAVPETTTLLVIDRRGWSEEVRDAPGRSPLGPFPS